MDQIKHKNTDFFIPCKDKKSLRRGCKHLYRVWSIDPIHREGNSNMFMFLYWGSFVSVAPTCTYFSAITHFLHCLSPPKSSRANKKSTKSHITVSMFCKSCAERHYTHLVTLYRMRRAQPLRCGQGCSSQEVWAEFLHEMRWESHVGAMPSFYSG